MNKSESQKMADYLELLGYDSTPTPQKADLILLNTCVVRQNAENKVLGMLGYLKGIKRDNPDLPILVTGCFVNSTIEELERCFPHIDLFFKPGDYQALFNWAKEQNMSVSRKGENLPQNKNIGTTAFVPLFKGAIISAPTVLFPIDVEEKKAVLWKKLSTKPLSWLKKG